MVTTVTNLECMVTMVTSLECMVTMVGNLEYCCHNKTWKDSMTAWMQCKCNKYSVYKKDKCMVYLM